MPAVVQPQFGPIGRTDPINQRVQALRRDLFILVGLNKTGAGTVIFDSSLFIVRSNWFNSITEWVGKTWYSR